MRHLTFATLLFAFVFTSCAIMSAEEKGQYLEQYRKIAAERQQRAFDGPHGVKDQFRAKIASSNESAGGRKVLERLVFTTGTGHGIDTIKKLLVDADVRAMDEVYTGEQVRFWVDFYQSERGKRMLAKENQLREKLHAEVAKHPKIDTAAAITRYRARYTDASQTIAHHFEAGVGRTVIHKQKKYLAKRDQYEAEALELFNKKIRIAIVAHNKKVGYTPKKKTKKSH